MPFEGLVSPYDAPYPKYSRIYSFESWEESYVWSLSDDWSNMIAAKVWILWSQQSSLKRQTIWRLADTETEERGGEQHLFFLPFLLLPRARQQAFKYDRLNAQGNPAQSRLWAAEVMQDTIIYFHLSVSIQERMFLPFRLLCAFSHI